jgi:hypothetical protein
MEKHTEISILDGENSLVRETTFTESDIERIGGVGAIVESIEPLLKEGERIEIANYWPEY